MNIENRPIVYGTRSIVIWNYEGEAELYHMLFIVLFKVKGVVGKEIFGARFLSEEEAFSCGADYIFTVDEKHVQQLQEQADAHGANCKVFSLLSLWRYCNERRNHKEDWIRDCMYSLPDGASVLDAGAGLMPYKKYCTHLNYTSQDFGEYSNEEASIDQPPDFDTTHCDILCDICDIPVEDGSFDAVLCSEVIEHLPYPDRAIRELSRVLKKGGKLFLTAPFFMPTHFAPYYYHVGFSEYWHERILGDAGFTVNKVITLGNFYDLHATEQARLLATIEAFCKKKHEWDHLEAVIDSMISMVLLSHDSTESENLSNCGIMVEAEKR